MMTWATNTAVLVGILSSFRICLLFLLGKGGGARAEGGGQIQSVINEHFQVKDLTVATKWFKLIVLF